MTRARRRVAVGSDHAGFKLKSRLKSVLEQLGYEAVDFGADSEESADYPDYGHSVSGAVQEGACELGLLACSSGIGMSMTANRHCGVRAALVWNEELAELARRHNDANVLVLPARFVSEDVAVEILKTFLESPFDGGRHEQRVRKIDLVDEGTGGGERA